MHFNLQLEEVKCVVADNTLHIVAHNIFFQWSVGKHLSIGKLWAAHAWVILYHNCYLFACLYGVAVRQHLQQGKVAWLNQKENDV